jgi:hypothetical protein
LASCDATRAKSGDVSQWETFSVMRRECFDQKRDLFCLGQQRNAAVVMVPSKTIKSTQFEQHVLESREDFRRIARENSIVTSC